jgi:hypothetical protein
VIDANEDGLDDLVRRLDGTRMQSALTRLLRAAATRPTLAAQEC